MLRPLPARLDCPPLVVEALFGRVVLAVFDRAVLALLDCVVLALPDRAVLALLVCVVFALPDRVVLALLGCVVLVGGFGGFTGCQPPLFYFDQPLSLCW